MFVPSICLYSRPVPSRIPFRRPVTATFLVAVILAALLVLSANPRTSNAEGLKVAAGDGPQPGSLARAEDAVQRGIRGCTNRRRIKHGLRPLAPARPLEEAASLHATSMSKNDFFDHIDPRGRDAADRVGIFAKKSRFVPIGENIGGGFNSARGACKAWMNSASHRANILNPDYTVIGAGFARGGDYGSYFVQVFGRER